MDAALVTRMFNVGYSVKSEPPKDVLVKKDSDFKDVLSKNMKDVKSEDNKVSKDVKKEDTEKIKTDENKDIDKKDVKRKDKKDDKKVKDSEDNETEKINGLIEQRLENVKNEEDLDIKVGEVEKIDIEIKDVDLQEDENIGLGENVDEVGPQSVETEEITLNEFEKLESKLDSLSEKLGRTNEETEYVDNEIKTDEAKEKDSSGTENEEDDFSFVDINEDVSYVNNRDVEDKAVKNKESKIKITDFRGNKTFNDEFNMTEMDVKNENIEIPKFDISGTNNIIMSKADKLQEQIDVLKQITEKVEVNILEDKSEMLIKLKPDNLGKVTMQISVENGNISAKFLAESQKVKEILESNMQELKDQLAKQGMALQEMSVSVGSDNRERQMFEGRNFGTFNRHSRINRIESNSYSIDGDMYDDANDENLAHYWPDSTVSFSA